MSLVDLSIKDREYSCFEEVAGGMVAKRVSLHPGDGPLADAFSRLRVSTPHGVFENKNIHTKNPSQWEELTSGVSSSLTHNPDEATVSLQAGDGASDYAIRQTYRRFAYVPGKSHLIMLTAVLGAGRLNTDIMVGYVDDDNGAAFYLKNGTTFGVRIRTKVTGSVVNNDTDQSSFNIDKLDGTGPSGITIDLTKIQIFTIDFQWLGAGRLRFGLGVGGATVYFHEVLNSNQVTLPYMSTPTLPIRYEIRNTGAVTGTHSFKEVCCSVVSEGGYVLPGLEFSVNNGVSGRVVSARTPVIAIRLKATFNSRPNRRIGRFLHSDFMCETNNTLFEIAHLHAPSAITATWSDVSADSTMEYSTDITAITGNPEHIIHSMFLPAGQAGKGTHSQVLINFISNHSYISQNNASDNSEVFVVYATPLTGSSTAHSSIDWIEFD